MKIQFQQIAKLLLLTCVMAFAIAGCETNEVGGPPVIEKVRLLDPAKADSLITAVNPGTIIVIQGQNLGTVKEVYFNDFPAPFNAALGSNTNVVITVPAEAPTEATVAGVTSKIRVLTDGGEATYNFVLTPPAPSIDNISNENALPGTPITISGSNFYAVEKVVFPGDLAVTDFTVTQDGKTITVRVPAALKLAGSLEVKTKFGSVKTVAPFNLHSGALLASNFDDVDRLEWGTDKSRDSINFPGGHGNFALLSFKDVIAGNGAWWDAGRSVNLTSASWVPGGGMTGQLADYALKFEVFVKDPWNSGAIYALKDYSWTYLARYEPFRTGGGANYTTTGWRTVTIPFSEFRTQANGVDGTGSPAANMEALLGSEGKGNLNIFFVNDGSTDVAIDKMRIGIDNIRFVKVR